MLPASRNRTYTGANTIVPGDLDDIQDCIIDDKHGDVELLFSGAALVPTNANFSRSGGKIVSTGSTEFHLSLPLRAGDRIKSVTFARIGDGAVDISGDIFVHVAGNVGDVSNSIMPSGAVTENNVSNAAWADTVLNCTDTVLASRECAYLRITANAAGLSVNNISVIKDRP